MPTGRFSILMRTTALACGIALLGTTYAAAYAGQPADPMVQAVAQTAPAASQEIEGGAVIVDDDAALVVGATALGGLEIHDLDGRLLHTVAAGEAAGLGVAYGFPLSGVPITLVGTTDVTGNALRFFAVRDGTLQEVGAEPEAMDFAVENLCFHHHALDGRTYAFVMGDGGEIEQRLVYEREPGRVATRAVRRVQVPSPVEQCVADTASGRLYVAEETVGLWRLNADPEAEVGAVLIDSPRFGRIHGEVKGLALYDGGPGARWLIASDADGGRLNVYDLENDDAYMGSVTIAAPGGISAFFTCSARTFPRPPAIMIGLW